MNWKKYIKPKFLNDKETHAFYGTLFFLFFITIFNPHVSFLFVVFFGAGVEVYDLISKKGIFEYADFLYTIIIPFFIYISFIFLQ